MAWRFLSSLRLTIPLLLGLALVSVAGTLKPAEPARYELFYQSFWFRLLLALLALNLAVCTVKAIRRQSRWLAALFEALGPERRVLLTRAQPLPACCGWDEAGDRLARAGYRVAARAGTLLAHRRGWGRWGATVVHLSLLLIMAGALLGAAGFVGTKQLYIGHSADTYFSWEVERELPLGFELRLDHFEPIYYPINVRFVVHDARSGRLLATLTAREGETVPLPLPGYTARIEKFIPDEKRLELGLFREGAYLGSYDAFPLDHRPASPVAYNMTIHPDAFQDPLLRQLHSEVSILRDGKVLTQGVIEVNQPLVFEGVTIYQTAFDRDQYGFWYAGFQLSRDPGEPLVWAGCVILVFGLGLAFLARPQALGLVAEEGRLLLVPLRGFAGDRGERALAELLTRMEG